MPNRGKRTVPGGPKAYSGDPWPDGRLADEAPVSALWAAEVSRRLTRALTGKNKSVVAREVGLARSTLYDLMAGKTWPDMETIVLLETSLGLELWPRWAPGASGPQEPSPHASARRSEPGEIGSRPPVDLR